MSDAGPTPADLLAATAADLVAAATAVRDRHHGSRITYSPKVFVPLTMLCRDKCGYCTFAQPPARLEAPYLTPDQVLEIATRGADAGCHEVLFTLGERPELRYPAARRWLDEHGHASTIEYLAAMCRLVVAETGLLPHANAGALHPDELAALREVTASQGMMIETLRADLAAHRGSPDKTPDRRLATLEAAGRLAIPFTTGILVGIGESRADRLDALEAIAAVHRRYGHVQEVIVQNFLPKPGTSMHAAPPCPPEEHRWTIAAARLLLPAEVHVQAPPNLSDDLDPLLAAGIDDWGGVSPVTVDHVNPERPWPVVERLREATEAAGLELVPDRWLANAMRFPVLDRSDANGLARDHAWASGCESPPPVLVPGTARLDGPVVDVLAGIEAGHEPGIDELVTLFSARGREVVAVCQVADDLRRRIAGDEVTWVANRNINYTNICTFKCRFCAFSKGPLSLNLRGDPYLLGLDEIQRRAVEAVERGATEVCLQGGIHPSFDGDYYIEVTRAVHEAAPSLHIHGFTALEVTEGARRLDEPLESYLRRLADAGLRTLPGTAAEILDDPVREVLCSDKIRTDEWLDAHRTAHRVGLRSNITIMFGAIEQPVSWARHLVATRDLQKETGGFTEFVPLPFVHMAAPIYLQRAARRGPTFREALLMHAVGRLAYGALVPNVQVSWVKMGLGGARQVLQAGANDLGGTLMDENISRAAGASHGQGMDAAGFGRFVEGLDRPLVQRTTLYDTVPA